MFQRLHRLRIAQRLFLNLLLFLSAMILIGGMALRGFSIQNRFLENITRQRLVLLQFATKLLGDVATVQANIYKVLSLSSLDLGSDQISLLSRQQVATLDRLEKEVQARLADPELREEERKILQQTAEALALYAKGALGVLDMAAADVATAAIYMTNADSKYGALSDVLGNLLALENDLKNRVEAEAHAQAAMLLKLFLIVIGLAALATALVSWLIARSIARPVTRIAAFALAVSGGDLKARAEGRFGGEMAGMREAIENMVEALEHKMLLAQAKEEEAKDAAATTDNALAAAREQEAQVKALLGKISGLAASTESIAEQVSSAAEELASQVEESSRGAEYQKQRVSETATAIEQMNATVTDIAKNGSDAVGLADQTRSRAKEGADILDKALTAIQRVQDQATALRENMTALGRQAIDIGRIINVISDIADQTNLLALNAAIEAARAGDAGRGFAVVADEVRKLAEKTMAATQEVGEAITSIQQSASNNLAATEEATREVEASTRLAGQSGQAMTTIVGIAEQTADQIRSIATATEEQMASTAEIRRTIEDINRVSVETATAMGESARAIVDLTSQTQNLHALIRALQA